MQQSSSSEKRPGPSFEHLAILVWGIALIAIGVRICIQKPHHNSVYDVYVKAGQHWVAHEHLYAPTRAGFRYAPVVAMVMSPLSLAPDRAGEILWRALLGALVLASLVAYFKNVVGERRNGDWPLLVLLALPLLLGIINDGQATCLLVAALLGCVVAVEGKRWNLAAICAGIACLLKIYPLAMSLLLVLMFPRKFGWRLLAVILVGALLPFAFRPWDYLIEEHRRWAHYLVTDDRQTKALLKWYQDLRLLFAAMRRPLSAKVYLQIRFVMACALAGIVILRQHFHLSTARTLQLVLGLSCCWMTVLGSATESSTYSLIVPALVTEIYLALRARGGVSAAILLSTYAIFIAGGMLQWFSWGRMALTAGMEPAAGLLFFAYLLRRSMDELIADKPVPADGVYLPDAQS